MTQPSQRMSARFSLALGLAFILAACSPAQDSSPAPPTETLPATPTPSDTPTATPTETRTPIPTDTPTQTQTPSPSVTPSPAGTATLAPTPTSQVVMATGLESANCRWGPDPVYLYATSFAEGESARVDGRNSSNTWLWLQVEGYQFHCWVIASAVTVDGELDSVPRVSTDPPVNPSVPSVSGVHATRSGNTVTITWNPSPASVDQHYLVRATVCNGTSTVGVIDTTTGTSYSLQDKSGCSRDSSARVWGVNKLGYASPVSVPWP